MTFPTARIGDLGRVVTGRTPPAASPEFFGDTFPFITPTDIQGDVRYVETGRFLSVSGKQALARVLLPENTVCVVCIGATIGKVCMTDRPSFSNQQINSIVVYTSRHDPHFVFNVMRLLQAELRARASGAATPIINKSSFEDVVVPAPDLPVQRRIGSVIAAYDSLIEVNKRRIAILDEMVRRLFEQWFIRPLERELPLPGDPLHQWRLPAGWRFEKLSSCAHLVMGQSPPSSQYGPGDDGVAFHQGVTDFDGFFHVDRNFLKAGDSWPRMANPGDVLFSVRAPVGRMSVALDHVALGRGLAAIRAKTVGQNYLMTHLRMTFPKIDMIGNGTIYKAVTKGDVEEIPILNPGTDQMNEFEDVVASMWLQIRTLHLANGRLRSARDLIAPRLVRGEITLVPAEADARAAA